MKRITQKDLARHLKVSQVTISRALANSPQISEATRHRVLEAAHHMGYQPDPVLSSLNAYRRSRQPIEKGQTLGWITTHNATIFYDGAHERAAHYGYKMEIFNPNAERMTPERILDILYNRSVTGLIFSPCRNPNTTLDIRLDNFCAVCIGYTLQSPSIDRVITDHHYNLMLSFKKLYEAGYRRIGLATTLNTEERIEGRRISSFFYQLRRYPEVKPIPVIQYTNDTQAIMRDVTDWIEQHRPDAIICHTPLVFDICSKLGLKVPEDIAVVSIAVNEHWKNHETCSGIDERCSEVGAMAVDAVVGLLRNNEFGLPAKRRIHMLEGKWQPGNTMRHPAEPA